jgi:hypothetical protein
MTRRTHLGIGFEIWNGHEAWFWRVLNSRCNAGAVGAAGKESDAMREACLSIEEMASADPFAEDRPNVS